ncbi:MAG: V-type ATPase subunit [Defluviitaleaceae bacterium]|nr:V-type ATPase subunit [Defluviitaleaceae bacterium]
MNYAALNAKLRAMSAKTPSPQASKVVYLAAINICRYIPDKPLKDFIVEAARFATGDVNIHCYTTQWKRLNRLDKPNRVALRSIQGAEIDLNNILWMYRLKRYHRVTGDGTYGYLVPIRYRLCRETTRRMADCVTPKALLDEVLNSPYATDFNMLIKEGFDRTSAQTPEQMLANAICRRYQAAARRYPNSLAPALAYLRR